MKLYHYVHCPFCVRVRMAMGFLKIPYESIVLPYDDEKTPVDLCQVKMLPIVDTGDGFVSNESLDIIAHLDKENFLKTKDLLRDEDALNGINELLNEIGAPVHNLAMPYWIWTREFDENSRRYFVDKKAKKRGPFHELAQKKEEFLEQLPPIFAKIQSLLGPYYQGEQLSIYDVMIASHLWGLYVIPEFQFPTDLHRYLQSISNLCSFNYHEDFWRKEI